MRKCNYCGTEYPDGALRCLVDEYPLIGGEPPLPLPADAPPIQNVPPVYPAELRLRIFELILVCSIAFGGNIITSIYYLFVPLSAGWHAGLYSWIHSGAHELTALALLMYVLHRRSQSLRDIGFRWAFRDIAISVALGIASYVAFAAVNYSIYYAGLAHATRRSASSVVSEHLFGGGVSLTVFLFQLLNPFYEELIVRAFVMTEIRRLTNSVPAAILVSTVLQASYHLYQGVPLAISDGAAFLVYSLYYAKTKRITPVILAHMYEDIFATFYYWIRHT